MRCSVTLKKRQKYDKYGDQWQYAEQFEKAGAAYGPFWQQARSGSSGGAYRWATMDDIGDIGDLGDIFDNLFRDYDIGATAQRHAKPKSVQNTIEVTLEEAYSGATRLFQLQSQEVCPVCGGNGRVRLSGMCTSCGGTGIITRVKRIEVKIPPGVNEDSKIRLAGEGPMGPGGVKGDLYLVVKMLPHKQFERKGNDLYTEISVPLLTAVLGGEVEVPLLKGRLALKIPPETQNGNVFRLAGKGMPQLGNGVYGDLYAKVKVVLPTRLTPREKQLFEELKRLRAN